jgi:rhamnose transport system permease protein
MTILTATLPPPTAARRTALPQQAMLAVLVALEITIFAFIGKNFLTVGNGLQVLRVNVDLGLLALAQTAVIVTGGIDLSVGSLLGLCAIVFGKLWRDYLPQHHFHHPVLDAAAATLLLGMIAGWMNGLLITRLRIPALIVTLGSLSLFRGLAEGITRGVDNFTDFPAHFLFLGQGYFWRWFPAQLPILAAAAVGFWLLLHRSAIGRTLCAIGYSPEGARHAGIRVERRVALVYVLSGLASAAAALIYVARVGQAKADDGTGFELSAITAVVLGGTSIFGGRASLVGTLLGLFAIAVLQNGLRLADLPPELAGILTGVLLLLAIGAEWRPKTSPRLAYRVEKELDMRNSQLAVLCVVILIAALIVTAGNFLLFHGLVPAEHAAPNTLPPAKPALTIAMMPKSKGNAYFIACHKGAEEAAKELGVNLIWDGPTDPDPSKQNEIVETWITRGVDVIAVSCENKEGLSTVLRKAMQAGIKVVTFDADAQTDARDFFVNQATPEGIGDILMDDAASVLGNKGDFAIITSSLTASNQNEWLKFIEARRLAKYPDVHMVTLQPCDDLQARAFDAATTIINAHPDVKLIMAICSPAVPGAAEAVKQSGRNDVKVVGLGLPNENKAYVHAGITPDVVLWNTMDLGYLTVYTAVADKNATLRLGDTSLPAGRLGTIQVQGDNVLLGKPFTFTKDNIDQFDF